MLGWLLDRAAASDALATRVRTSDASRRVAARYVAGETADAGVAVARRLADDGVALALDHVGEHITDLLEAEDAASVYRWLLDHVRAEGLPAGISVKPTQLGLTIDRAACLATLEELAGLASDAGVHVTLDMEGSALTEATVRLVEDVRAAGHDHVGCAIQAYLHRTPDDLRRLSRVGASVRLCKGAYAEPDHLAWQRRIDVDRAYLEAARYLLRDGIEPRFATHDHRLVGAIQREAAAIGRARDSYEFQMLYGVRPQMQRDLVRDGYRLRVYLPFGTQWFPYFVRRLAERPANLAFFLRALTARPIHPGA